MTATLPARTTGSRRPPLFFQIATWSIPTLVLAQYSMVAIAPVAVITVAAFVDARVRPLRLPIGFVAASYVVPLAIWILRDDPARSLSKDMHPMLAGLIVAASIVALIMSYWDRTRPGSNGKRGTE